MVELTQLEFWDAYLKPLFHTTNLTTVLDELPSEIAGRVKYVVVTRAMTVETWLQSLEK